MDKKNSPEFKEYSEHFSGRSIPYWAILDKSGKKLTGFVGGQTYETLLQKTSKYK